MRFLADFHLHSRFSRATSHRLDLSSIWIWAQKRGICLVGTGDLTHPAWMTEIIEGLIEDSPGIFALKRDQELALETKVPEACRGLVRFLLTGEISTIYKRGGKVRKVHHLVLAPSISVAKKIGDKLAEIGNVCSDGRPILGLDSRDLLEILLEMDERCCLIPAHIWTPWFSVLGSKSGYDSIEECYRDLSDKIIAVETGLSSDPPMNWRLSGLDRYTLVSNSDAHCPQNLGRNACIFDCDVSYPGIIEALKCGNAPQYLGTVDMFPQQGKYHFDGHRRCGVRLHPKDTQALRGLCPVCRSPLTVGVLHRVQDLADRAEDVRRGGRAPFVRLVFLREAIAEVLGRGPQTKAVNIMYESLLSSLGSEMHVLMEASLDSIENVTGSRTAEAVRKIRAGEIDVEEGYDGVYGTVRILSDQGH